MSRKTVPVKTTELGREPDYDGGYNDAVYYDDNKPEADALSEGEVSIIPL